MDKNRKCRHCYNAKLYPSRRGRGKDTLLGLLGLRPWRCSACDRRYYQRGRVVRKTAKTTQKA
jgi:hypothetical protein